MIARVAESCFWLHRYVERVDNTSRLMGVNFAFLLDRPAKEVAVWRPLLVVAGVEELYMEQIGEEFADDGERVQEYLVWNEENPVSAINSLSWARENARTIRETLSLEAWTALNRFWLWMRSPEARDLYATQRTAFYDRMRENCQLFHGVCHDTLLHEDPFEFMRLGMFLERGAQTARILDTKYHAVGPTREGRESSEELAEWIAILQSCSAYESFFKRSDSPLSGKAVAEFLILDRGFPRSVMHCLKRAENFLQLIGRDGPGGPPGTSLAALRQLMYGLETRSIDTIVEQGLHEVLTEIVDSLAAICGAVEGDFFSGKVVAGNRPAKQLASV